MKTINVTFEDEEHKKLTEKKHRLEEEIYSRKHLDGQDINEILKKGEIKKINYQASRYLPEHLRVTYHRIKTLKGDIDELQWKLLKSEEKLINRRDLGFKEEYLEDDKEQIEKTRTKLVDLYHQLEVYVPNAMEDYEKHSKKMLISLIAETNVIIHNLKEEKADPKLIENRKRDFNKYMNSLKKSYQKKGKLDEFKKYKRKKFN